MTPVRIALLLAVFGLWASADAEEGMYTPEQLPAIAADLQTAGLELEIKSLAKLTDFPMGAVISLGGCTASFVSSSGLAVTNHHCARGSVQYNSTPERNYLADGFLANRFVEELPAAPGTRIYVTLAQEDVTGRMRDGLEELVRGRDVEAEIEARRKAIVGECEARPGHRCLVASFFGGAEYKLIDRLEIRDVRLVYAPADSIGKYGGDVDNWMWPRHTGDFAFYRAYVGRDGAPADFSMDNVPYQPEHSLKVSASGLETGDFVMVLGYPGRTSRYARLADVRHTFGWQYPNMVTLLRDWIAAIEAAAPEGSDGRLRYEARLAGLNNYLKNLGGQIEGAERVGLIERRAEREAALDAWLAGLGESPTRSEIAQLDVLSGQVAAAQRRDFWYDQVRRPQLLNAARRLYRLARERELPDEAREPGYQERDMTFFRQSMTALDRRFDPVVDKAEWLVFLRGYAGQSSAGRIAAFDRMLDPGGVLDEASLSAQLDAFYAETELDQAEVRLALMDASPATLEASADPFMRLAVATYDADMAMEDANKELAGRMVRLRPAYMEAIKAWQRSQGRVAYPDANSTLRISYGTVMGPPSGGPAFTSLEDILDKDTGEAPFDAPQAQLDAIRAGNYGAFATAELGTVPVNFMSDLDVTGGNSGSATLNARGELVGLLFDGTLDSVNSDWDFDPDTTRAIHVDSRYMLWVMEKVDGAGRILGELTLTDLPVAPAQVAAPDEPPAAMAGPDDAVQAAPTP